MFRDRSPAEYRVGPQLRTDIDGSAVSHATARLMGSAKQHDIDPALISTCQCARLSIGIDHPSLWMGLFMIPEPKTAGARITAPQDLPRRGRTPNFPSCNAAKTSHKSNGENKVSIAARSCGNHSVCTVMIASTTRGSAIARFDFRGAQRPRMDGLQLARPIRILSRSPSSCSRKLLEAC